MTTTDAKLNNSIGLAMKAGKIASGDFSVEKAVRSGTAKLVMLDESAIGPYKGGMHAASETFR